MDGIGSSWLTIILVFLVVGGMVFFVTFSTAEKLDSGIETQIKAAISDFVNECANIGKITPEKAQSLQSTIHDIGGGIRFDLKITVKSLDSNPSKKTTQLNNGVTEVTPYIETPYTVDDITAPIILKENDWIGVSVQNISATNSDVYSGQSGTDLSTIVVEDGVTVRVNGN